MRLTDAEYDRFVVLAAGRDDVIRRNTGGLDLKQTLEKMIQTADYRNATDGPEGGKATAIKNVIIAFRAAAKGVLISEFPDLRELLTQRSR